MFVPHSFCTKEFIPAEKSNVELCCDLIAVQKCYTRISKVLFKEFYLFLLSNSEQTSALSCYLEKCVQVPTFRRRLKNHDKGTFLLIGQVVGYFVILLLIYLLKSSYQGIYLIIL